MNRIFFGVIVFFTLMSSCTKSVRKSLHYSVTNDANDSVFQDVYIPYTGTYDMKVKVKFLEGYLGDDKVTLILTGLPARVKVTPDTFVGIPSYVADFVFKGDTATQGVYAATMTAYTDVGLPQAYNFNIHVIPPDCAGMYWNSLTGKSACTSRSYSHAATGTTGGTNVLMVNNFGGYGTTCNVKVVFNCNNDSLSIPYADYGNGVKLQGKGIFNADSMVINYTASTTPTGGPETCTLTYKRM